MDGLINQSRAILADLALPEFAMHPQYTFFYAVSDGKSRAEVFTVTGKDFNSTWQVLVSEIHLIINKKDIQYVDLSLVTGVRQLSIEELKELIATTKRNYFRYGIALDNDFKYAFTEKELNANAMLYGGNKIEGGILNEKNFHIYAKRKYLDYSYTFENTKSAYLLSCQGVFIDLKKKEVLPTYPTGLHAGRRIVHQLDSKVLSQLIHTSSEFLAEQVDPNTGRFYYGWHPCFDRSIDHYNTLRHASSVYSMLEAWEVTRSQQLLLSIEKAIDYLINTFVTTVIVDGRQHSFLTDMGREIKLGGTAACLLMLCKYTELIDSNKYLKYLSQLSLGILYMQQADASFVHVLNYPDLSIKEKFRIVYYDGEALFSLMLLYKITKDQHVLETVEKFVDYCIQEKYWQYNDHWLAYAISELVNYKSDFKYYKIAIDNIKNHLGFVQNRVTTFPTLLELAMATEKVISRLKEENIHPSLLEEINLERFYRALHIRAAYLLNGYFWPEYAMYYKNPQRIVGSFFIRHHAFRVRIDDVEHYLSGLIAYKKFIDSQH